LDTLGFASVQGMIFLGLSAMIPGAHPPPCTRDQCAPPDARHLVWLLAGFASQSIGAGGVRPCSMAFGVDQFSRRPKERRSRILQAYFNAYYASAGVAFMVAITVIVYVQDNVGLTVPACLMPLSTVSFLLGPRLYIKERGDKKMLCGIGDAVVAAVKNSRARLPAKTDDGVYHHVKDCKLTVPTDRLRFLNKACMISADGVDASAALGREGNSENKKLCTVDQVEQLKSAIRACSRSGRPPSSSP
jgi:solute carrier family 15 (peptide/histidine transporter), member 3/4